MVRVSDDLIIEWWTVWGGGEGTSFADIAADTTLNPAGHKEDTIRTKVQEYNVKVQQEKLEADKLAFEEKKAAFEAAKMDAAGEGAGGGSEEPAVDDAPVDESIHMQGAGQPGFDVVEAKIGLLDEVMGRYGVKPEVREQMCVGFREVPARRTPDGLFYNLLERGIKGGAANSIKVEFFNNERYAKIDAEAATREQAHQMGGQMPMTPGFQPMPQPGGIPGFSPVPAAPQFDPQRSYSGQEILAMQQAQRDHDEAARLQERVIRALEGRGERAPAEGGDGGGKDFGDGYKRALKDVEKRGGDSGGGDDIDRIVKVAKELKGSDGGGEGGGVSERELKQILREKDSDRRDEQRRHDAMWEDRMKKMQQESDARTAAIVQRVTPPPQQGGPPVQGMSEQASMGMFEMQNKITGVEKILGHLSHRADMATQYLLAMQSGGVILPNWAQHSGAPMQQGQAQGQPGQGVPAFPTDSFSQEDAAVYPGAQPQGQPQGQPVQQQSQGDGTVQGE